MMIRCPSCNTPLADDRQDYDPCPSCGAALVPQPQSETATPHSSNDADDLGRFKALDAGLHSRIAETTREGSWHLAMMAEILDFQVRRLSESLNQAQAVVNRMFNLSTASMRASKLDTYFNEFLRVIGDLHKTFCHSFAMTTPPDCLEELWTFCEQTHASVDRLLKFHVTVAKLRFVRESDAHRIQSLMMDWAHHELVCLEELRKQLSRKSNFEPDQLKERSVQVTLAPPNLQDYYQLLNAMRANKEGL